jgi:hypothetical protein
VTRDPAEGVDGDGVIVTGAAVDRVPAVYRPVVEDCTAVLTEVFGGRLHSLYLYGSVATGQARPPESDVDLIPIWVGSVAPEGVADVAAALSRRHCGLAREVGLAPATLAEVRSDGRDGLGLRCFLRHYCVCLAGTDLRPSLPACRASRAVAEGFNDDVPRLVRRWRSELEAAQTPDEVALVARAAARKLLLVAATLESAEHGGWTTDRRTGATMLAAHHPQWAVTARQAVDWCAHPDRPTAHDVHRLLDLGDWLAGRP